jgi:hemolysin D
MTKLSWLTVFTTATLTSQAFIIPAHGQSSYCSIPAQGKIEPSAAVQKVQSPIDGVVKKIYVRNGDRVKAGDPLIQIESAQSFTLLAKLQAENQFYRNVMISSASEDLSSRPSLTNISLKSETSKLIETRNILDSENRSIRAKLLQLKPGINTQNDNQSNRLLRKNLVIQIEDAKSAIKADRARLTLEIAQIDKQVAQTSARIIAAKQTLEINQSLLNDIKSAAEAGAVSRIQLTRQESLVKDSSLELERQIKEQDDLLTQKNNLLTNHRAYKKRLIQLIEDHQVKINQLDQDFVKLQLDNGKRTLDKKELYAKTAENSQRIAKIDLSINKIIIENDRKILEINNRSQKLKYGEVRSPINGVVFELNTTSGSTIKPNSDQPLVQIVPEDNLIAKVYIMDKDIGYIKNGMPVSVRIDSFNFVEFGDIQGTVESISLNALPPDQISSFQRFPAIIRLNKQAISIKRNGVADRISLQPGMSVNAVIQPQQCSR